MNIYERKRQKFNTKGPSLTQQSAKLETDVNHILKQFSKTGLISHVNNVKGLYADVSDLGDYRESLEVVAQAHEAFLELPSKVRKEFSNDPAEMMEFLRNPLNKEKAVELGLIKAPIVEKQPAPKTEPKAQDESGNSSPT